MAAQRKRRSSQESLGSTLAESEERTHDWWLNFVGCSSKKKKKERETNKQTPQTDLLLLRTNRGKGVVLFLFLV
jgi:hypothetical protein